MPISVHTGGSFKTSTMSTKVGGSWVPVKQGYVRVAGVWRLFYTADVVVVAPTSTSSQTARNIFEAAQPGLWASTQSKRLLVNSAIAQLIVNSPGGSLGAFGGMLTIEVTPTGSISGNGGSSNSGVGQDALSIIAGENIRVVNNGIIRGGGGGGGRGGYGGDGASTTGGQGGIGGRGQGIDGNAAAGLAGAAGSGGSGTGGTGGTGGAYGSAGATGSTGSAGTFSAGFAGLAGGASGRAIVGYNRIIYSGTGTLLGGTTNS